MKLKPGVLNGIKHVETVEVEYNGEKYEIDIRPLRHSEAAVIQGILSKGLKVKTSGKGKHVATESVDIDMEQMIKARYEAQLKASAMGTVDPAWTEQTIDEQWLPEWIVQVGDAVMRISGIGNPEEVEQFRKK